MKTMIDAIEWRLFHGSLRYLAAACLLLAFGLPGIALATERVVSKRLKVDPAPTTQREIAPSDEEITLSVLSGTAPAGAPAKAQPQGSKASWSHM